MEVFLAYSVRTCCTSDSGTFFFQCNPRVEALDRSTLTGEGSVKTMRLNTGPVSPIELPERMFNSEAIDYPLFPKIRLEAAEMSRSIIVVRLV